MNIYLILLALTFISGLLLYNAVMSQKYHKENNSLDHSSASDNYKLGFFYFDTDDKRVCIPKKGGGGNTINFGNPLGVIALILFAVILTYSIYHF